jgi:hypothetical protein
VVEDDLESQAEQAYEKLLDVLRSQSEQLKVWLSGRHSLPRAKTCEPAMPATQRIRGAHPMAITVHIMDGLGIPGALVGIEAVCALGE